VVSGVVSIGGIDSRTVTQVHGSAATDEVYALDSSYSNANRLTLAYLMRLNPDYTGTAWEFLSSYDNLVEVYPKLEEAINIGYPSFRNPEIYTIKDPFDGMEIEITHLAATLDASVISNGALWGKSIAGCVGWAGDLYQAAGKITKKHGDWFKDPNKMYAAIGSMSSDTEVGFSYLDLVQDVDAYNMFHDYSFERPIYEIFNDYYNVSKYGEVRFGRFKTYITYDFQGDALYDVALRFLCPDELDLTGMRIFFMDRFGTYDGDIAGKALATAFEKRINDLASQE